MSTSDAIRECRNQLQVICAQYPPIDEEKADHFCMIVKEFDPNHSPKFLLKLFLANLGREELCRRVTQPETKHPITIEILSVAALLLGIGVLFQFARFRVGVRI